MTMQDTLEKKLHAAFSPSQLEVINETHMHNVPAESESHFKVIIICDDFEGKMLIARHRLVNAELKQEISQIHALALHTFTPSEWDEKQRKTMNSPPCKGGDKSKSNA